VTLRTCVLVVLLVLLVVASPLDAQTWSVYYLVRGISSGGPWCATGMYEFLKRPGYTPVYLMTGPPTYSVFIGMYGAPFGGYPQASLPPGFPTIAFPSDADEAVAVPSPCPP